MGVLLAAILAAALIWVGIAYCYIAGACGARTWGILDGRVTPLYWWDGLLIEQ
jgi:hypothetical protein